MRKMGCDKKRPQSKHLKKFVKSLFGHFFCQVIPKPLQSHFLIRYRWPCCGHSFFMITMWKLQVYICTATNTGFDNPLLPGPESQPSTSFRSQTEKTRKHVQENITTTIMHIMLCVLTFIGSCGIV